MMSKEINDLKQQIIWLQNQNASLINRQEALRDHFAGMAMQGLLSSDKDAKWDEDDIALIAYGQADAMLERKDKNVFNESIRNN
jgi:hypothetical protein